MDFKTQLKKETSSSLYKKTPENIKANFQPYRSKPINEILNLHNIMSQESVPYTPNKNNKIINFFLDKDRVKQMILLTEGTISIERVNGRILLGTSSGPGIFGMDGSEFRISLYRLKCLNSAKLKSIPYERGISLISQHGGLQDFITCQRYYNDCIAYNNNILINHSSLEIICAFLIELSEYPYEERLRISAVNFVRDRSNLARSGVMRIFSKLRQLSCIDIQDGKLISINKVKMLTL
ncbi:hypothetical protein EYY94_01470 [Obesumbacterium proteus]|uniref:helix-turn-helix domain-containing protein n=1 Tax=Obesumbacterium proteus TaxID=82983 RepID=UPI001033CCF7|nr:helix-turn-helix domain-containing protein [Obesumbacterium proteus]TBL78903.1 hypothetical protein EYY94_01470 [Obesumbacterium proteus]